MTLLGPAGIGKTRLAEELRGMLGNRARVLTGRCLPYGDGITFWPLVELLRALGPEGLETAFADVDDRDAVLERLADVTGAPERRAVDELFWGARRLVEVLAAERPLLLVFEDVDRGEPTFLDLLDYLHSRIEGAPVLVLCLARPELLDRRPALVRAARPRGDRVARAAVGGASRSGCSPGSAAELDDPARERVLRSAEGNPLYVEQLAALAETGELVVPPTIQALLAERLDRLEAGERAILERAAIVGQEFSRRAVTDLCPPELRAEVGRHLLALVRKELIRPHASASSAEDGYRFRHGLIRDVAYEAMPKEARALFHEWFADWMERNAGERLTEIEEIVGYHLEQAVRLRARARPGGRAHAPPGRASGRAARRLGPARVRPRRRAGRGEPARPRARRRDGRDRRARRARDRPGERVHAQRRLLGRHGGAAQGGGRARRTARRPAPRAARGDRARVLHRRSPTRTRQTDRMTRIAESAIPELEKLGDELGLAKAWWLLSEPHLVACRWGARAGALECALEHARRAGDAREVATLVGLLATAIQYGPTPVAARASAAAKASLRTRPGAAPRRPACEARSPRSRDGRRRRPRADRSGRTPAASTRSSA